ncbi:MAG: ATP-dependent Clp protease adaptor ClpS [Deltaproteobacteria bacterium]
MTGQRSPSGAGPGQRPIIQGPAEGGTATATATRPETRQRLSRPPRYKDLLHNDDFTPIEFVVAILREVFYRSESESMAIMLHAHTHGVAVAGVYAFEVAEVKAAKVMALAKETQLPLLCTIEPEDSGSKEP